MHCPTCRCSYGTVYHSPPRKVEGDDGLVTCGHCGHRGDFAHIKECRKDPDRAARDLRALAIAVRDALESENAQS